MPRVSRTSTVPALALAAIVTTGAAAGSGVVIDMPAPPTSTYESFTSGTAPDALGAVALDRYANARTGTRDVSGGLGWSWGSWGGYGVWGWPRWAWGGCGWGGWGWGGWGWSGWGRGWCGWGVGRGVVFF